MDVFTNRKQMRTYATPTAHLPVSRGSLHPLAHRATLPHAERRAATARALCLPKAPCLISASLGLAGSSLAKS